MAKKDKIFIQIASYRDPELLLTLRDCIGKAKYPERLRFGICKQSHEKDEWDVKAEFEDDKRFTWFDVKWNESKGVCWARHMVQGAYKGEDYTLQLDSHHRFQHDWDEILIKMVKQLQKAGHKKPLLTAYVTPYDPSKNKGLEDDMKDLEDKPCRLVFDRFTPEGCVFMKPHWMDGHEQMTYPEPAKYYSAHFAFTIGDFCTEVPHDPNYYFHGEEISIAARAFTHGYDLFAPHINVVWHEYTREYRESKHWVDHVDENKPELVDGLNWVERNNLSHQRNRILFGMEPDPGINFGEYGFGTERTLEEYEQWAGIDFKKRCEIDGDKDKYTIKVNWDPSNEFTQHHDDIEFVVFAVHDKDGSDLHREDFDPARDADAFSGKTNSKVVSFETDQVVPDHVALWPFSKSDGWLQRITKPVSLGY
mgnify:FL=1|tara:strand:+ start:1238 stop:2500 length:1263 start_codon:yes stop_codon:yes gene_type:complete